MYGKKRILFIGILILLIAPLIFAVNYGAGNYSSGVYVGEEITPGVPTGGGGGSSYSKSVGECSLNSECGYGRYCFENKCHDAECFDDSICKIEEGERCWNYRCVKLFDIEILEFESPVKLGEFFEFTYFMKSVAEIDGDVVVDFWLEKDGEVVTSGFDTIYIGSFEGKTKTKNLFLPSDISSGTYEFFIQLRFDSYTASTHRTVEITVDEEGIASISIPKVKEIEMYVISALIGLAVFIISLVFYLERKKIRAEIIKEKGWIKKHKFSTLVFLFFVILGILVYYLNSIGLISFASINNFFVNAVSWIKNNVLIYFSPQNKYFYYVVGSIAGLIVLIVGTIIAKKKHWIRRFRVLQKQKRIEEKKLAKKKVKYQKPKTILFLSKHKKLLLTLSTIIILTVVIAYLFYKRILTLMQLQTLWDSILSLLINIYRISLNWIFNAYNSLLNWIIQYYVQLIVITLVVVAGIIFYRKRENIKQTEEYHNKKVTGLTEKSHKSG